MNKTINILVSKGFREDCPRKNYSVWVKYPFIVVVGIYGAKSVKLIGA